MLNRIVSALLVALVTFLVVIIAAALLELAGLHVVAAFLNRFAELIAVIAGVAAFLNRSFLIR